jgi:hypothetical protein
MLAFFSASDMATRAQRPPTIPREYPPQDLAGWARAATLGGIEQGGIKTSCGHRHVLLPAEPESGAHVGSEAEKNPARPEEALVQRSRPFVDLQRLMVPAARVAHVAEVHQHVGRDVLELAAGTFADAERAHQQRFGVVEAVLLRVEAGEVAQPPHLVRMVWPVRLVADRQRLGEQRRRFVQPALTNAQHAEVSGQLRRGGQVLACLQQRVGPEQCLLRLGFVAALRVPAPSATGCASLGLNLSVALRLELQ